MRIFSAFLIFHFCQAICGANPLIWEPERGLAQMIEENVTISVQDGRSLVRGEYLFERDESDGSTYIKIDVPVIGKLGERLVVGEIRPVLRAAGRSYKMNPKGNYFSNNEGCPRGYGLGWFTGEIPSKGLGGRFKVDVEYFQPHIQGNTAAYLPINPPQKIGLKSCSGPKIVAPSNL